MDLVYHVIWCFDLLPIIPTDILSHAGNDLRDLEFDYFGMQNILVRDLVPMKPT